MQVFSRAITLSTRRIDSKLLVGKILSEDGVWWVAIRQKNLNLDEQSLQSLCYAQWEFEERSDSVQIPGFEDFRSNIFAERASESVWKKPLLVQVIQQFWKAQSAELTNMQLLLLKVLHVLPTGSLSLIFLLKVNPKNFLDLVVKTCNDLEIVTGAQNNKEQKQVRSYLVLISFLLKTMTALGIFSAEFLHENAPGFYAKDKETIVWVLQPKNLDTIAEREVESLCSKECALLFQKLLAYYRSALN